MEELALLGLRALLLGLCLVGLFLGGQPEKAGASLLLLGYLVKLILESIGMPLNYFEPNIVYLLISTSLFFGSLLLVVSSNRAWPMFFSAFYLIQLAGHLSVLVLQHGMSMAYWGMIQVPIIAQALVLLFGTFAHIVRIRSGIVAPDWRLERNS